MLSTELFAHDRWDGPGPWWPFVPLFWILFFLLVLWLLGVLPGRRRHGWRRGSFAGESRLAERYAAGEIDETEYRRRLAVLREKDR